MAASMTDDAILGIVFGAIFGTLFLAICFISAVKAVKDRKRIKARIAERERRRREIRADYDAIADLTSVSSPNEDARTATIRPKPGVEDVSKNLPSNNNATADRESSNKSRCTETSLVSVEVNHLANGGSMSHVELGRVSFVDNSKTMNTKDLPYMIYDQGYATADHPHAITDNLRAIRNHPQSLSDSQIPKTNNSSHDTRRSQSSTPSKNRKHRVTAWEQTRPEDKQAVSSVTRNSHTPDISVDLETRSQWKDKTYFGPRPGARTINGGVYRCGVDVHVAPHTGYRNEAYH